MLAQALFLLIRPKECCTQGNKSRYQSSCSGMLCNIKGKPSSKLYFHQYLHLGAKLLCQATLLLLLLTCYFGCRCNMKVCITFNDRQIPQVRAVSLYIVNHVDKQYYFYLQGRVLWLSVPANNCCSQPKGNHEKCFFDKYEQLYKEMLYETCFYH